MANITFFDTSNNIIDIVTGINTNSAGFPVLILGSIAVLLWVALQRYPVKHILVAEGFILSSIAALLIALGWLDFYFIMLPILALVGGLVWSLTEK